MMDWQRLRDGLRVYADRRMMLLIALGFSSGVPLLLVGGTLQFWLWQEGLSRTDVALFSAAATPYVFKFLWAPLVDRMRLPWLTRRLGMRRGWLLVVQIALAFAIAELSSTQPRVDPWETARWTLAVAFLAATQDILIDAYRIDLLPLEDQGAGAAAAVLGYRLAMLVTSAGALYAATYLGDWSLAYLGMAPLVLVGIGATLVGPFIKAEPPPIVAATRLDAAAQHMRLAFLGPLVDILKRPGAMYVLAFVALFKLGDGMAGVLVNVMLKDVGFTNIEIANIAKTFGLGATLVGLGIGGALVRGVGVVRAMWFAGFVQLASNLMFCWQAYAGHDVYLLVATITVENVSGGVGTAAFVAYMSGLCSASFSATQYALLTALAGFSRRFLAAGGGVFADTHGWVLYFAFTAVCAVPGLLLLYVLQRRGTTGLVERPPTAAK